METGAELQKSPKEETALSDISSSGFLEQAVYEMCISIPTSWEASLTYENNNYNYKFC